MGLSIWSSTLFTLAAVLVLVACWAVGAYRRLKQLRLSKRKALGYLLVHWSQEMDTMKGFFPDNMGSSLLDTHVDQASAAWRALYAAIEQVKTYTQTLNQTSKPANANIEELEALRTARVVLLESWQRLENSTADLAGARIPIEMQQAWERTEAITTDKMRLYNQRVERYNHAITQFPASILCKPYGFQKAIGLI